MDDAILAISVRFGHHRTIFCFSNACNVSMNKGSGFVVSRCEFWPTLVSIAPEMPWRER